MIFNKYSQNKAANGKEMEKEWKIENKNKNHLKKM